MRSTRAVWSLLGRESPWGAAHIDTAEAYGTEGIVGEAVREMRGRVFIATKVSRLHLRYDEVLTAAEDSLKRLGTDHIDLYQVHGPNPDVPIAETMRAMDKLVEQGKIRFVGVSNFSVTQLKEAQGATTNKIVSNQVRYNLIDRAIESELFPYCLENKVTIIAYSPLAAGLHKIGARLHHRALQSVAEEIGKTEAQVALNWCISKEGVIAIPKSNSSQRTEENCLASGWRLSRDQMTLLDEAL